MKTVKEILRAIAIFCILWGAGELGKYIGVRQANPLQGQGYEATLSYKDGLVVYFEGEEMTVKEWQTSMGVKADGIVGDDTLGKALELNRTDVR